ncbi:MAG: OprD family outer membrane porin [Candidatus Schmidhempelia sp.]|nr:OprD family outer membrane porin [Candidatus Schmidhempelia sp.]
MDDDFWLKGGFIQPSGQTLLASHWSLLPGTYRGVEVGTHIDYGNKGTLSISYMWTDKYKAPWYKDLYRFRQWGKENIIRYLHSGGFKYNFKNNLSLEGAFGQAHNYMNQYFAKLAYQTQLFTHPLSLSYQFYGAKDQHHIGKSVYDGLAWLQAATLHYQIGAVDIRTEGVMVKAEGNQGFFLQRMTPGYASSNGRLDIWWNSRSDFNADGERALFGEISYDLGYLSPMLQGWRVATSYAYGWHAKPNQQTNFIDQQHHYLKESAWNFDLSYTVPDGWAKDSCVKLHYTRYDNHANRDWHEGYDNIFLDEHDIKFIVTIPFTVFNLNNK